MSQCTESTGLDQYTVGVGRDVQLFAVLVIVPSIGDYATTVTGLLTGGMRESNPTARLFMDSLGVPLGFLLLSLVGIGMIAGIVYVYDRQPWVESRVPVVSGLCAFGSIKLFATAWNASLLL